MLLGSDTCDAMFSARGMATECSQLDEVRTPEGEALSAKRGAGAEVFGISKVEACAALVEKLDSDE